MIERNPGVVSAGYLSFLYCMPAIIAILLVSADYYIRIGEVGDYIDQQQTLIEKTYLELKEQAGKLPPEQINRYISENLEKNEQIKKILTAETSSKHTKQLINYYLSGILENKGKRVHSRNKIHRELVDIWFGNAMAAGIMAIFPFLLLGSRFGYSKKLPISYAARREIVDHGWWMKLCIGFILVYGWLYVINPQGRGTSAIAQFLTTIDLSQEDTLPIFLRNMSITPVIAGFLGWYLYMLTYFFSKMATNDVISSQIYGVLFKKFLFTYGFSLILPAPQSGVEYTNINAIAFLIGFFPMSAFSLLKDSGIKAVQGVKAEKGQLIELPGISRWQILRLEEEGIDSMGALAYSTHENLRRDVPGMARIVDYWMDIAQLYSVVGQENYHKVKKYCFTATGFIEKTQDPQFVEAIFKDSIGDAREISRILTETFPKITKK